MLWASLMSWLISSGWTHYYNYDRAGPAWKVAGMIAREVPAGRVDASVSHESSFAGQLVNKSLVLGDFSLAGLCFPGASVCFPSSAFTEWLTVILKILVVALLAAISMSVASARLRSLSRLPAADSFCLKWALLAATFGTAMVVSHIGVSIWYGVVRHCASEMMTTGFAPVSIGPVAIGLLLIGANLWMLGIFRLFWTIQYVSPNKTDVSNQQRKSLFRRISVDLIRYSLVCLPLYVAPLWIGWLGLAIPTSLHSALGM